MMQKVAQNFKFKPLNFFISFARIPPIQMLQSGAFERGWQGAFQSPIVYVRISNIRGSMGNGMCRLSWGGGSELFCCGGQSETRLFKTRVSPIRKKRALGTAGGAREKNSASSSAPKISDLFHTNIPSFVVIPSQIELGASTLWGHFFQCWQCARRASCRNCNGRQPWTPGWQFNNASRRMGRSCQMWRCSNTWVGCSHMTTTIARLSAAKQPMDLDAARASADPEPDFGQGPVEPT